MSKSKKEMVLEHSNIVEDFYIGGTHIKIADNYCKDKTTEDVNKILNRISEIAIDGFRRQQSVNQCQ